MNELQTLMSQQIELLQKQLQQQTEALVQQENYSKQLIEQNNLLKQENILKSELITTLKNQIASIESTKPSDDFLQKFELTMNQHLQTQLIKVLDQSNLQRAVNQLILNKINPFQEKLVQQLSILSSLDTTKNKELDLNEIERKLQQLESSVEQLIKLVEDLLN